MNLHLGTISNSFKLESVFFYNYIVRMKKIKLFFNFFLILTQGHFSLLLGREEEGERNTDERKKHQSSPVCAWTGDGTCNLSMCPGWEWNPQPFGFRTILQTKWTTPARALSIFNIHYYIILYLVELLNNIKLKWTEYLCSSFVFHQLEYELLVYLLYLSKFLVLFYAGFY